MAAISFQGNSSGAGSMTIIGPATDSNLTLNIAPTNGTLTPLVFETEKTATGSSVDFTNIPSWVSRITVILNGISCNTASGTYFIRIGSGGTVASSGYVGIALAISGGTTSTALQTTGFYAGATGAVAATVTGTAVLQRASSTSNTWIASLNAMRDDATDVLHGASGSITLAGTLNILSVTVSAGAFDAGTINIVYE